MTDTRIVRPAARGAVGVALACTLLARPAGAAGLYFSDEGVRPLSRAGAFVAGADDLGAMHYNPAGLADAGTSILVDASWLNFRSDFTRQTQVADASGAVHTTTSPTVHGTTPFLPIPTLGASLAFGSEKQWTVAVGMNAPYAAAASYPLTVSGQPSPSRYSLLSLNGSLLAVPGVYLAYKPIEQIRIGVGAQLMVGSISATAIASASPADKVISAAEDTSYDAYSQLKSRIVAPSGNAGVTFVPDPHVRIGLSYQLPFSINAPSTVNVQLPSAAVFDNATQVGHDAQLHIELPPELRAGVELRTRIAHTDLLRIELAYCRQFWTVEHTVNVDPTNIKLYNVTAFPSPYALTNIAIPRNFENSNEVSLGGEFTFPLAGTVFDLRSGVSYEQSAIPPAYLSVTTLDLRRVTLGTGASVHLGDHWRIDVTYAHIFALDQTVDPAIAAVPKLNAVNGNPTTTEAVNGGMYSARADVLGAGMNYKF